MNSSGLLFLLSAILSLAFTTRALPASTLPDSAIDSLPQLVEPVYFTSLLKHPKVLFFYGTRWCHDTQDVAIEFADYYHHLNYVTPVNMYFVDCDSTPEMIRMCKAHKINHYPTLNYYEEGKLVGQVDYHNLHGFFLKYG